MQPTLLVANRGEIACRVLRAARSLSLRTVAVYSQADRDLPHVRMADAAVEIGPARPAESYLNVEAVLGAAKAHGASLIHRAMVSSRRMRLSPRPAKRPGSGSSAPRLA